MANAPSSEVETLITRHRSTLQALVTEGNGTEASRILARRAASLSTWMDSAELLLANGRAIDMSMYLKAASTLKDLLGEVGPSGRHMHDITPPAPLSDWEKARRLLFAFHRAKQEGRAHLLPQPMLDLLATVEPSPEPPQ